MNKSLLIYSLYEKQGYIDDYVIYFLKKVKEYVDNVIIIINGKFDHAELSKIDNNGYDTIKFIDSNSHINGFKKIIEQNLFKEEYDNIIFTTSDCLGPFFKLDKLFEKINTSSKDIFAIISKLGIMQYVNSTIDFKKTNKFFELNFFSIKGTLLNNNNFIQIWSNYDINNLYEAEKFESEFTDMLSAQNLTWETYIDLSDYINFIPEIGIYMPITLVEKFQCPIISNKCLKVDYDELLYYTDGRSVSELINYLNNNTNYDTNLIYNYIIRTKDVYDIKNLLHLNYILSDNEVNNFFPSKNKVALMMHLYFEDLFEDMVKYIVSMPEQVDIYISTNTNDKKIYLEEIIEKNKYNNNYNITILVVENRGRDVSSLLVGLKKYVKLYHYICFIHDKKVGSLKYGINGFMYGLHSYESVLFSKDYVDNIIYTFEKEEKLGLLVPPLYQYNVWYSTVSGPHKGWGQNVDVAKYFIKKYKLNLNIDFNKTPIAPYGSIFWFRVKAIESLFDINFNYEDFDSEPLKDDGTISHVIERIYPYIAKSNGYYTGWVMPDKIAAMQLTSVQHMLSETNKIIFEHMKTGPFFTTKNRLTTYLKNDNSAMYKKKYEEIMSSKIWKIIVVLKKIKNYFNKKRKK